MMQQPTSLLEKHACTRTGVHDRTPHRYTPAYHFDVVDVAGPDIPRPNKMVVQDLIMGAAATCGRYA
ncbi:hypothetical protein KIH79_12385 [Bifidobacterium sp. 82T10]|uniref:Uncharacterized protein n=1 Tax=Bifidobacterium miconis TaxID=2834435 RepID=A0ABS6WKC4_9BIFI|nr:hypothetical protein [Bifidobacterium miconis]MBW3093697.1 hypothetical protein [Bifidobacterium miconis]